MSEHIEEFSSDFEQYRIDEDHVKEKDNTVLEQATKEEDYQQIIDQILQQVQNGEEDIQKCLKDLKKCLDEYFNHHNQKNFAPYFRKSLKQLIESAISFLNQEKLDMSLIILNECDMLVQTFSGFPDMQILTYNNLSCYFRKCKDQKRALKLLEKAENIYSKNQTTTNMGITFLNKSAILSEMGRHQEAIKCAKASVKELKNQFEKVFEQKKLHQEKYLNMKNFKNSMLSNSKVDNSKLEEDFYQREEQTKQINLEFQDIATELGIAYHNLATEEQYFKLFDRSIKNFFNAYTIVKEYLGDNHPLTSQFHQSFQAVNKKYQQHISNSNENDQGKQKKFHNKINESPEYYSKDLNSIQINNNELAAIKTQNSIEDVNAQEEKEHKQSFKNNDIQLQRKNITSQQDAKNRNMLKKQVEGTVIDYKQQMKAINLNMYNLLYSDDDGDEGQNEMQIPNTQARIELYKNKYQQPPQGKSTVSHKKPQIYNQMYFDNLKEMNQFKIKQQKTLENQEQTNNKNMKVSKASDLIENLMESPKSTEKRINIFEIDQMLIRRNKSNQTQRQKGGSDLNFGQTQYKYGQDPKEQQAADLNHPAFFLAKKMQGKYTKLSTIRPMTAQEILDSPPQKKEVGGRKYKVNPKLLIPDTVIEATNRYQDYLQREKQQNQKKSFVIKSTSTKNISQSDKEKHEKMFNLEDINTDQENAKFDKKNLKTQQDSQSQKALPQGKHQSSEKNISKGGQENDNNNFKQKLEQMKQKIVLNQQESERLKNQNKKWNFETIKDDQTNQEKNNYKSQQSQQKRGEAAYYSTKIPTKSQDRRIHSQSGNFEAATQIPQEYQIVSPYMNSTVRAKSSLVSAIQKGRMCCVFDENSYNLIIAFQDIQSGQGVDMEDQCRFYINLSNLREIFSKEDDSKYQTHQQHSKHYNQYLQDHPQEFNDAKLHMLRYNLETLFKKFKPLLSIDIEKKCLVVEQNFSGYTVQIKTPLHPKGIVTKLNFYSQNSSIFTLPSSKNSSESQKNLKNMLVVEYPAEELFLQKENKKLEELEENYIILQKFVYASLSNKQGMLATLFNTNTLQLQFNFKSLDQQVDIFHYVVVEPIIQDYGPYFESEDTQIALSILCENLVTMWKYDGKNLTYDKKDKWSLKNEVEIPNQGKKQLQYQIIQQPSNDFSIIQKKEAWIEIYEDDNLEFQINKKELLDKIDESHESEDESKQEKIPFSNQHYKPNQSQFSQNEKGNHSNQPSKKFQIVNKYEEEEYEFDDEDEKNQNVDKTQPHTKNQDNQSKNSSRIPSKHESNQDIKENISNGFQKQQKIEQKQSNIDDQYKIDKENIQKPNRNSQKEKEDFSKLQQPNNTSQNQQLDSDQRKQSSRQNSVLNETNGGDSSKNTRQKNLSNQFARPQSSKKQMDIRNNLSKGSPLNNLENQDILDFESSKQVRQAYDQQNQDEDEEDKYNDQQKLHQQDQINKEERKSSVIYQSTNQNKNQDNKNNVHTQNEQKDIAVNEFKQQGDNCSKKVQNRERPEATYSKSRNNSIKIQQEQIKNNYSLNISQEKEGDVEYIDINDTQQIV